MKDYCIILNWNRNNLEINFYRNLRKYYLSKCIKPHDLKIEKTIFLILSLSHPTEYGILGMIKLLRKTLYIYIFVFHSTIFSLYL